MSLSRFVWVLLCNKGNGSRVYREETATLREFGLKLQFMAGKEVPICRKIALEEET